MTTADKTVTILSVLRSYQSPHSCREDRQWIVYKQIASRNMCISCLNRPIHGSVKNRQTDEWVDRQLDRQMGKWSVCAGNTDEHTWKCHKRWLLHPYIVVNASVCARWDNSTGHPPNHRKNLASISMYSVHHTYKVSFQSVRNTLQHKLAHTHQSSHKRYGNRVLFPLNFVWG